MKQSGQVVEIIPSRFYWLCDKQPPTRSKTQILCTDEVRSYIDPQLYLIFYRLWSGGHFNDLAIL